jgi:hypothetical protein
MKITVEFEEKDIRNKVPLVDQWGTRHMIVGSATKTYLFNLLNLKTNNLVYECALSTAELVKYLNMCKFYPEN